MTEQDKTHAEDWEGELLRTMATVHQETRNAEERITAGDIRGAESHLASAFIAMGDYLHGDEDWLGDSVMEHHRE